MAVPKHILDYRRRRRVRELNKSKSNNPIKNNSVIQWSNARKLGKTLNFPICKSFDNRKYLENLKFNNERQPAAPE